MDPGEHVIQAYWIPEPHLVFGGSGRSADPKVGISLYGPRSVGTTRHKSEIHISFLGLAEARASSRRFYAQICLGVEGDADHAPFPGSSPEFGYYAKLVLDPSEAGLITRKELNAIQMAQGKRRRFQALLDILDSKIELIAQRDHPCDCIVLCLSKELVGDLRAIDYAEPGIGRLHRDLRRSIKAIAMKHRVATQILWDDTVLGQRQGVQLDHPSVVAWNLFNGLYFKADGLPWGPSGVEPGSCFIGVSFYKSNHEKNPTMRTSCAQAFDEEGEGLVLRGHSFEWDEDEMGRSPHLPEHLAHDLIQTVLQRYRRERTRLPSRVVVHKSSDYQEEEREGFQRALEVVDRFDLVSLRSSSDCRLVRIGKYPPLRGTGFRIGERDYLYTTGYLLEHERYPHGHVPSPIEVSDHVGDTERSKLLHEVLELSKMNWNSANMHGRLPITLEFSRVVADVLRELPEGQEPEPKYKYYM